jgi:pyridoxamine 5'-phosphate oxidase
MPTLRERLRAVPSVTGSAPAFDPASAPDDPRLLLLDWLDDALDAGVLEPLAITLATTGADGADARVLMLKDVTPSGELEIATTAEAAKSRQLELEPRCAVSVYWRERARAIRMRGVAHRASAADAAADFLARSPHSRALVLAGRQGAPIDPAERAHAVAEAEERIAREPGLIAENWVLWRIDPTAYEFWQGDDGRDHIRVRYEKDDAGWRHERVGV